MKRQSGFSLIEVLVAGSLMALLLGVFGLLYQTTMQGASQTDYQSSVQNLANVILQAVAADLRQAPMILSPPALTQPGFPISNPTLEPPAATPITTVPGPGAGLACTAAEIPRCVTFSLDTSPTADRYTYWYGFSNGRPVIYLEQVSNTGLLRIAPGFGRVVRFASDDRLTISNFEVRTFSSQASIMVALMDTSRYANRVNGVPLTSTQLSLTPFYQSTFVKLRYY